MKNLNIPDSYNIWQPAVMNMLLRRACLAHYNTAIVDKVLHRSYISIYIEWWLHNIGYYITKPFCFVDYFNKINLRCKDVDIEEWENE